MSLIPTFKAGERVILHFRLVEDGRCPKCNARFGDSAPVPFGRYEAEILAPPDGEHMTCQCGADLGPDEGWYHVRVTIGGHTSEGKVPYTLLERIPGVGGVER